MRKSTLPLSSRLCVGCMWWICPNKEVYMTKRQEQFKLKSIYLKFWISLKKPNSQGTFSVSSGCGLDLTWTHSWLIFTPCVWWSYFFIYGWSVDTLIRPVLQSQWKMIWLIWEGHTHCCCAGVRSWLHLLRWRLSLQSHLSWWRSYCRDKGGVTQQCLSVWVLVGGLVLALGYWI